MYRNLVPVQVSNFILHSDTTFWNLNITDNIGSLLILKYSAIYIYIYEHIMCSNSNSFQCFVC